MVASLTAIVATVMHSGCGEKEKVAHLQLDGPVVDTPYRGKIVYNTGSGPDVSKSTTLTPWFTTFKVKSGQKISLAVSGFSPLYPYKAKIEIGDSRENTVEVASDSGVGGGELRCEYVVP
jgi:hypothetical protein